MNYIKISLGIFLALAASRFVPHPPNFTSLLALSFYVPTLVGVRFIPALILGLAITDYFLGFHNTMLFTWGSIFLIGLISKYFTKSLLKRICGALTGAVVFFIVTNFGVWSLGTYGLTIEGFLICYTVAIPFFAYSLISTFIFSVIIETIYSFKIIKSYFNLTINK